MVINWACSQSAALGFWHSIVRLAGWGGRLTNNDTSMRHTALSTREGCDRKDSTGLVISGVTKRPCSSTSRKDARLMIVRKMEKGITSEGWRVGKWQREERWSGQAGSSEGEVFLHLYLARLSCRCAVSLCKLLGSETPAKTGTSYCCSLLKLTCHNKRLGKSAMWKKKCLDPTTHPLNFYQVFLLSNTCRIESL